MCGVFMDLKFRADDAIEQECKICVLHLSILKSVYITVNNRE